MNDRSEDFDGGGNAHSPHPFPSPMPPLNFLRDVSEKLEQEYFYFYFTLD